MQRSVLCRSRRELSHEYLLAKFGFDTAENEPLHVCEKIAKVRIKVRKNVGFRLAAAGAGCGDLRALADVTWAASAGDRWLVCGPSGTGKTSFLRVLAGTRDPVRRGERPAGRAELLANGAIRPQNLAGSIQTPGGLRTA